MKTIFIEALQYYINMGSANALFSFRKLVGLQLLEAMTSFLRLTPQFSVVILEVLLFHSYFLQSHQALRHIKIFNIIWTFAIKNYVYLGQVIFS